MRLGMPKPWMAVLAVPAVKLPQGVTGCLQLLDLQFLSTDSCTDSEEAGVQVKAKSCFANAYH